MTQIGFYIDQSKCTGCKACVVSCKDNNDLKPGMNFRRVYHFEEGSYQIIGSGHYPSLKAFYFSISCNHCTSPACLPSCPTGSILKREEDGVVLVNQEKCVGARFCIKACPYGAPQFDKDQFKMAKCDTCLSLRENGEEPVCISSCPQRAIQFGPVDELREKYGNDMQVKGMPKPVTKPNLIITPHRDAGY